MCFQLYDILEKAKLWRQQKDPWWPVAGVREQTLRGSATRGGAQSWVLLGARGECVENAPENAGVRTLDSHFCRPVLLEGPGGSRAIRGGRASLYGSRSSAAAGRDGGADGTALGLGPPGRSQPEASSLTRSLSRTPAGVPPGPGPSALNTSLLFSHVLWNCSPGLK